MCMTVVVVVCVYSVCMTVVVVVVCVYSVCMTVVVVVCVVCVYASGGGGGVCV